VNKKYPELVEKQLFPSQMKALSSDFDQVDVQLYAFSLKNMTCKHHITGLLQLRKIIALTHEQDVVVIDVMDRSFIDPVTFPKEGSYLYFENINFIHSIQLDQKDLSFEIFENPKHLTEKERHISYD
tara:strand:- start:55 stop:435 length:381 start_codon:yes stop_codon:yes gene_type:complete